MVALSFPSLTSVPLLYCVSSVQELTEERIQGFPGGASGQESVWQCRRHKGHGFDPWVGKIPWRRARRPAAGQNPVNRKAWWATALWVAKQPNTTEATQHTHKKGYSRAPWTFLFHRALLPPFCFETSSGLNGKCGFSRSSAPVLWKHPEQDMEMGWGGPSLNLTLLGSPVFTHTLHCLRRLHFHNTSSKTNDQGTSLEVHWLRLCLPMQGVRVQSLVGELRSHMPWGQNNQKISQKQNCNKFNKDLKTQQQQR